MITPEVIARPAASSAFARSNDDRDGLCEYLDERDPVVLLEALGTSRTEVPSSCPRYSDGRSLCNFRPKKDLPPEDWRVLLLLLSTGGVVDGIA